MLTPTVWCKVKVLHCVPSTTEEIVNKDILIYICALSANYQLVLCGMLPIKLNMLMLFTKWIFHPAWESCRFLVGFIVCWEVKDYTFLLYPPNHYGEIYCCSVVPGYRYSDEPNKYCLLVSRIILQTHFVRSLWAARNYQSVSSM